MAVKKASTRRRSVRSVKSLTNDQVETDGRKLPRLGKRQDGTDWHPKIKTWWNDVWHSPVSANFDKSDYLNVWILADIKHRQLKTKSNAEQVRMGAEARQMENVLGLNPKARAVQKVEIDRSEQAERRISKRRNRAAVESVKDDPDTHVTDPRDVLSA